VLRLLLGVFLLPLSAALAWAAAKALAGVALASAEAAPFLAGGGLVAACWLIGRYVAGEAGATGWILRKARWFYVLGHELTHALAAWSTGGKVFAMKVGEKGGHVDVSETGAFVALAPYCVPFHALMVVVGYRAVSWLRPQAQAESLFLFLIGAALAFHALMTWESLTDTRQPDLDAAGGLIFSLAVIVAFNGLLALGALKALFPGSVSFASAAAGAWRQAAAFWGGAWALGVRGWRAARRRLS
jgi:hypothetical protein